MSDAIRWSLITVSYNNAAKLASHWTAPRPADVEWIVVDNASTDSSAEVAESLGATVIRLPENLGFGGANNVGYRAAAGQYIAFANPDLEVDTSALGVLEASLDLEPSIIGPQLVYPDGSPQESGRGVPSLWNKVLSRLGSRRAKAEYYLYAAPGEERYVGWVTGAAVVGRRAEFDRVSVGTGDEGPWDRRFFVYYEDTDLCLRAWRADLSVRIVGDARWTHSWARETKGRFRWQPWRLELSGAWAFYTRYPGLVLGWGRRAWWARLRDSRWGRIVGAAE